MLTVVLPAGLAVALAAIVVAAVLNEDTATAPTPSASPAPGEGAGDGPRAGRDHWHAIYEYTVCGERQLPAPTFEGSGIHTHGDGIIHIHPFGPSEEGAGARLVKWFEYGGGLLDEDEVRLPGQAATYRNGDECPDGSTGKVQVFVNGERLREYTRYIPRDGDRIAIVFGPERDFVRGALTIASARLY